MGQEQIQIGGQEMRNLADDIRNKIPGLGFALLVFEVNKPGIANYVGNCNREDMIKALRETADRLENNQTFKTPERS